MKARTGLKRMEKEVSMRDVKHNGPKTDAIRTTIMPPNLTRRRGVEPVDNSLVADSIPQPMTC